MKPNLFILLLILIGASSLIASSGLIAAPNATASHGCSNNDLVCLRKAYSQPIAAWPVPEVEGHAVWQEMDSIKIKEPQNNQALLNYKLGKRLFFDTALSASGKVSCASCHQPDHAFSDSKSVTPGHEGRLGKRNAPTLAGVASVQHLFWDGRSPSLEDQALGPISNPVEMAMDLNELPSKLRKIDGYLEDFNQVWGTKDISLARIQSALAHYQRTLLPQRTAFDAFIDGDYSALNDQQLEGLHIFRTQGRCMTCHHGAHLSDNKFHNLGLSYFGRKYEDLGRYYVTGKNEDVGGFRTPTLRNVSRSGPWMHNGLFPSLKGIVTMYNAGMFHPKPVGEAQAKDARFPVTTHLVQPLKLNESEMRALLAFLEVL